MGHELTTKGQLLLDFRQHCIYFSFKRADLTHERFRKPRAFRAGSFTHELLSPPGEVDSMGKRGILSCDVEETAEVLRQFVAFFSGKGWLNQKVAIRSGGISYLLFCDESRFFAYRMNDNWGVPPGVPGWPVCLVTSDHVFHDRRTCASPASEPSPREWLRRLMENDFEVACGL